MNIRIRIRIRIFPKSTSGTSLLLISLIYLKFVLLRFFLGATLLVSWDAPGFYSTTTPWPVEATGWMLPALVKLLRLNLSIPCSTFQNFWVIQNPVSFRSVVGWIKIADLLGRTRQRENKLRMLKIINYEPRANGGPHRPHYI